MGYQALLFCPDEKTARTVTQVLSELDFTVIPCTEPFAAVKQLMAEHFDAIVVDCDNEQNATLLFKSARNAAGNQSSLAVAMVEGQAGVAKAFRIGANLVLTKPINVDQAKGTLRVARGLLRKGETVKSAVHAAQAPAVPVPSSSKPEPRAEVLATPHSATSFTPTGAKNLSVKPTDQTSISASASGEIEKITKPTKAIEGVREQAPSSPKLVSIPQMPAAKESAVEAKAQQKVETDFRAGSANSGAASAPAPAKEGPSVSSAAKSLRSIPEPEISREMVSGANKVLPLESAEPVLKTTSAAAEKKPGGKVALIAFAAVVLVAAGGYEAWSHWGSANSSANAPAAAAQTSKSAVATAPVKPEHLAAQQAETPKSSSASQIFTPQAVVAAENTQPHQKKISAEDVRGASEAAAPETTKIATAKVAKLIVITNHFVPASTNTAAPVVSMNGIADANNGELPSLMTGKAPTPVLQTLSVSQGVSQGLLVKKVQPSYPQHALQMNIEGGVQLLATVSKNGDISAVKILSGDPELARAATDAVKRWKYKPYLLNGSPVEIQTRITVNFKLPR